MNISDKIRLKMLWSGIKDEFTSWWYREVSVKLTGTCFKVTVVPRLRCTKERVEVTYITTGITDLLTCKDSEFSSSMNTFVKDLSKNVKEVVKDRVADHFWF